MKIRNNASMITLLIGIFTILVSGIASAAVSIEVQNLDAQNSITVSHNSDVPISFRVINDDDVNYNSLNWAGSRTDRIGTWKTLPTDNQLAGRQTKTLAAVLSIPRYVSGSFMAMLQLKNGDVVLTTKEFNVKIRDSPTLTITKPQELSEIRDGMINITNTGNVILNNIELSSSGDFNVIFSENNLNLAPGSNRDNILVKGQGLDVLKFGVSSITVTVKDINTNAQASTSFSIEKGFCRFGEAGGNLTINDISIDTSGEDEDVWKPLDEITIEVEVENDGDEEIEDVFVELGLFNDNGKNIIDELDFMNEDEEKIEVGDLDDGDDDTPTFKFKVPANFDDKGNFKLTVKVFSKKSGEKNECADHSSDLSDEIFQDIEIEREDEEGKLIAFDDIVLTPSEATCGDTISLAAEVFNLGEDEQDQVKVNLINNKLNLNLFREIREDLGEGDKKKVEFSFIVPKNAVDGTYTLELSSEYDFRRGDYRESSDEPTTTSLKIFGCSITKDKEEKKVAISASLDSEAKTGSEMSVKAIITNMGEQGADFVVTASGYESWAKLDSISEKLFNLKKGESKDITLKFMINQDATGEQGFVLEVRSGSDFLETREVSVNIAGEETGGQFKLDLGGNNLIWIIGVINIILIILIIVVAVRISRR